MNTLIDMAVGLTKRGSSQCGARVDEYVCWSRMQAEAGQHLEAIVARKEIERSAGSGCFFWGVGNAPAVLSKTFARASVPVRAVFSIMKSKPKPSDLAPSRTVAWRCYIDAHGAERPLPPHALVTSRGDSSGGEKRFHYALMCHSVDPLAIRHGESFDPTAFRNAGGAGAPVGASQVTALLRRVVNDSAIAGYEANISAWLTGSYWVRLTDPVELDATRLALMADGAEHSAAKWCGLVALLRSGPSVEGRERSGVLI